MSYLLPSPTLSETFFSPNNYGLSFIVLPIACGHILLVKVCFIHEYEVESLKQPCMCGREGVGVTHFLFHSCL